MRVSDSQLERKTLARGAWRNGQVENAEILLDSVLAEDMPPDTAAECYVAQSAFRAEVEDYEGSLACLELAAPYLDCAPLRVRGSFYLQRGRAHKELGRYDEALTDYTGAVVCWQESGNKEYEAAALNNLAGLYLKIGNIGQARACIDQALNLNPVEYLSQLYDTDANILLLEGKGEQALRRVEQALSLAGENEIWKQTFLETKHRIKLHICDLLVPLALKNDIDNLQVSIVRHALDREGGSITRAANIIGMTHKGVAYIAHRHGLSRKPSRTRRKSLFTKK